MKKYTEKGSAYYYCKECEDEVNCKGHLTKPKKAAFFIQNIMCYNMQRMQVMFILEKKRNTLCLICVECQNQYFSRKSYTTHLVL